MNNSIVIKSDENVFDGNVYDSYIITIKDINYIQINFRNNVYNDTITNIKDDYMYSIYFNLLMEYIYNH
jgi:hypothetical protein